LWWLFLVWGLLVWVLGLVGGLLGGVVWLGVGGAGAVLVGLIEAFSSFRASAYKEIIVFTLIIPVLLWRSLNSHHVEEEDE
jgi:branched-chain amino acid transport system permease protein